MNQLGFPYKNATNQKYSKQLFYEKWIELPIDMRRHEPPFTLNNEKEGFLCFRKEYVNDGDPTGYTTAMRIFKDYFYWEYLCGIAWFNEAKEGWDRELDAKLKAEGIKKIRELAQGDDPKALNAAKFLATLDYKRGGLKRGRPSKEEIDGNIKAAIKDRQAIDDDAARIKLVG
jgi:hypothetical protein